MAPKKKAASKRQAVVPESAPVQHHHLDSAGKDVLNGLMGNWGRAATNAEGAREKGVAALDKATQRHETAATPKEKDVAKRSMRKHGAAINALDTVKPALKDRSVSLRSATKARTDLVRGSADRARVESQPDLDGEGEPIRGSGLGGGSRLRAAGVGWYYDHHSHLAGVSESTGVDKDRVITASAVMSPMNSPANELSAVGALAHLHTHDPELSLSPTARRSLGVKSRSIRFSALSESQAASIGDPELRSHITGVDADVLGNVAKGGTRENVAKAIGVLRGSVAPEEAINPHSSAKVWGYRDSIQQAVPGTAEHEEYMTRANTALFEMPGQQTMDLFGLRGSREGMFDPKKNTAEDTWQNAISSGQQLEGINAGRHDISPAKFVGSDKAMTTMGKTLEGVSAHPSGAIGAESLRHAWNNEATIRSARQLSRGTDVNVPNTVAQEVAWTEARRRAGKDPAYQEINSRLSHFNAGAKKPDPNQGTLF